MNGKLFTILAMFVVPVALLGVTIAWFSSNPISVFTLISVMVIGGVYLLTYRDAFGREEA